MAVYTEVAEDELEAFLATYDIGTVLSFKGIAEGVENSNYLLHTEAGYFILTLYEKRVSEADLPFFLGLLEHLSAHGVTCPQPVHNRKGAALGRLAGKPAVIVTFLDGVSIRRPEARHCGMVGEALGRMHEASANFRLTRGNALSIHGWLPLFRSAEGRADEVLPGLAVTIAEDIATVMQSWPEDLPRGVIHADLFPDNVFFLAGKLSGLIDFYFACNDFLAFDIAVCINAWCFEPDRSFNVTKARALIQAYDEVRPLTSAERRALPLLARGTALRFLLTRLYDWIHTPADALVKRKDPLEYLTRLRFHRGVKSLADYGL